MSGKIAVTGANGWLGAHLTGFATARGLAVRGIVRSRTAASAAEGAGAEPWLVDGLAPDALGAALRGCDSVVHLAGISAEHDGQTYAAVNVAGMRSVIAAALAEAVRRVVFLSGLGVAHYGQRARLTNGYFLAKWRCEVELFAAGLEACVLRPSYIVGPGDELVPALLGELEAGPVEIIEDGAFRMQPIAVDDACEAIVRGCCGNLPRRHTVVDLVGPAPISYRGFVELVAAETGREPSAITWRSLAEAEADRRAAGGGYRGLLSDELDVLLCDEIADAAPVTAWLGRAPRSLDQVMHDAVARSTPRQGGSYRRALQVAVSSDREGTCEE
jgi:nucleoside-diphosphate-sugar epimerase